MPFLNNHTSFFSRFENSCLTKISKVCECNNSVMTLMYYANEDCFIYCDNAFKDMFGGVNDYFLNKSWNYWFSLINSEQVLSVRHKIKSLLNSKGVLDYYTLDYHIITIKGTLVHVKHDIFIRKIENHVFAINYLMDNSIKEHVDSYFDCCKIKHNDNYERDINKIISPREKEVLALVADGYSSKQIASKLYISDHTAISHRKNLIEKFKAKNTAQLIKKASRLIDL